MEIQIEDVPIRTRWPGGGHKDELRTITVRIETDKLSALADYLTPARRADIAARMKERRELPPELTGGRWADMGPPCVWIVQF